ncbi:MAG: hypothetical protein KJ954_13925, partial [Alphaproteobacteria bacterium]|nr:hypothetical protein [Alphaproteobacteria bacterium]
LRLLRSPSATSGFATGRGQILAAVAQPEAGGLLPPLAALQAEKGLREFEKMRGGGFGGDLAKRKTTPAQKEERQQTTRMRGVRRSIKPVQPRVLVGNTNKKGSVFIEDRKLFRARQRLLEALPKAPCVRQSLHRCFRIAPRRATSRAQQGRSSPDQPHVF